MKNNYEASEAFEFGRAHDVVLGSKPPTPFQNDAILGMFHQTIPDENDIDESDE